MPVSTWPLLLLNFWRRDHDRTRPPHNGRSDDDRLYGRNGRNIYVRHFVGLGITMKTIAEYISNHPNLVLVPGTKAFIAHQSTGLMVFKISSRFSMNHEIEDNIKSFQKVIIFIPKASYNKGDQERIDKVLDGRPAIMWFIGK